MANKMRFNKPKIRCKGSHLQDPFLAFIEGTDVLRNSFGNGMMFNREIEDIMLSIFPYITSNEPLFILKNETFDINIITMIDLIISEQFNIVFEKRISDFFREVLHELLIVGNAYYSIFWDNKKEYNDDFILPYCFHYLRTETMNTIYKNRRVMGYRQQYSKHTIKKYMRQNSSLSNEPELWRFDFSPEEVIHFKYPFGNITPVQQSIPYFSTDRLFSDSLLRMKLFIPAKRKSYKSERLRYKSFSHSKDDHDKRRAKISKLFFYVSGMNLSQRTSFYEAYRFVNYCKRMNTLRQYLIDAFNSQIMLFVASKNNIDHNLELTLNPKFFSTDEEIDRHFEDFKNENIDINQMYKQITKDEALHSR
jgi:hypothetical protein